MLLSPLFRIVLSRQEHQEFIEPRRVTPRKRIILQQLQQIFNKIIKATSVVNSKSGILNIRLPDRRVLLPNISQMSFISLPGLRLR